MKKIYLLLLVFAFTGELFSQCNPTIPSNAVVIASTQTTGFGGSQIWVCSGVTLTSNGGSNTIYLEVGATLMAGGGSNTIYCPPGATINISSGSNIIYYVNVSDLVSSGGGPTLNQCTGISFNYSTAPTPGCLQTTGISEENPDQVFIYPNPSSGMVNIIANGELTIYNSLGKKIWTELVNGQATIDLSTRVKGLYFYSLVSKSGGAIGKLLIN